jgi:hypothetical protein
VGNVPALPQGMGMERRGLAPLWGPLPIGERLLSHSSASQGRPQGKPGGLVRGEAGQLSGSGRGPGGRAAPSLLLHRGCGVPGMGLDKGLRAGCPPGPRPWMSTRGTSGRCSWGWGAGGVRYMLLYMAAAAAAAVVLSMLPSRLG